MKTLITLLLTAAAMFAQTKAKVVISVTDDADNTVTARITGQPALHGLDSLSQWMAKQQVCTPVPAVAEVKDAQGNVTTPAVPASTNCVAKFKNAAEVIKSNTMEILKRIAPEYPSAATRALEDDIKAKRAQIDAARKALFEAAEVEQ